MSVLLSAIIFIITSGGIFTDRFKNRPVLRAFATFVAFLTASYLIIALYDDVRGFWNRGTAISENDDMLDTPAPRQVPVSNLDYRVVDRGSQIDFLFPMSAMAEIGALSRDGDLASTGFNVDVSERLSVSCTHWVTQGAGDASNYGLTSVAQLLPKLQCNAWSDNGDGSSSYVPDIPVSIEHNESDNQIAMTLESTGVFRLERSSYTSPCVFWLQNQLFDFVVKQDVEC